MLLVKLPEVLDEIQRISSIEGAVLKDLERFQVLLLVIEYKIVWRMVHHGKELLTLVDDGHALPPGKYSSPKACDLYILLL